MYCQHCGKNLLDQANFCQFCGGTLVMTKNTNAQPESINTHIPSGNVAKNPTLQQTESKGVGGWLYYLIGMLVFVIPALSVNAILGDLQIATNLQNKIPGFGTAVGVNAMMQLAISAFAIFCGFLLWTTKPQAILITKIFFVVYILYTVFGILVVTTISNLPPEIENSIATVAAKNMTRNTIFPIIWLSYLFRSKRVKATYKS